jgi:predicted tellurium resistance membrane protein TerC
MRTAYVLMGILLIGFALTCFYILAECLSWRTVKDADHKAMREIRELYKKLHSPTKPFTMPFVNRALRRK